jgi:hypothetical protein
VEWEVESAVVSTCMQGRSSACMQSTYLEVELDEGSEGRPELRLHVALAHEMERRPLRRCEGLEEAELL